MGHAEHEKQLVLETSRAELADLARDDGSSDVAVPGKQTLTQEALRSRASGITVPSAVGRRTRVEDLEHDVAARTPVERERAMIDRLRSRGLRDVRLALDAMRRHGSVARELTDAVVGEAMWRVAERRAMTLYRRAVDDERQPADPDVEHALQRIGHGRSLPAAVRTAMERALGVPLERVRIHTDGVAAEAARAVRAEAFTVGEDIFFADGKFAPETDAGARLLAHELAHVLQSWQGRTATSGAGIQVSRPGDHLELEAESVADKVGSSRPAIVERTTKRSPPMNPRTVPSSGRLLQRVPDQGGQRGGEGRPLTQQQAQQLVDCVRILRDQDGAFCRDEVPGPAARGHDTAAAEPVRAAASALLAIEPGRLGLAASVRAQFEEIRRTGAIETRVPRPRARDVVETMVPYEGLLRALQSLAASQTPAAPGRQAPFELASLFRAHHGQHAQGRAVDISRFGGHSFDMANPTEALEGVVALLEQLPPGLYAMGLPRIPVRITDDQRRYARFFERSSPPRFLARYAGPAGDFGLRNPFFPIRQPSAPNQRPPEVDRPMQLSQIGDADARSRIEAAAARARQRGASVLHFFPDACDHVHLSTGPDAASLRRF
ncbi:MAG TPA: DUF4157 domain-containing protein [Kofleriaceae bacterium]|nr:DUF4157 domain-containing protein [Kofleriaceae bacterium]